MENSSILENAHAQKERAALAGFGVYPALSAVARREGVTKR
jgi:hypothetical protein